MSTHNICFHGEMMNNITFQYKKVPYLELCIHCKKDKVVYYL